MAFGAARRLVPLGLLLIAFAACRQIVGISDHQSCQACSAQHCAAQQAACAGSAACTALESCLAGCAGEPACRSQCVLDHPVPDGADLPASLDACVASSCASACNLTCGGLSKVASPSSAPACSSCIQINACTQALACANVPACQRKLVCRENCQTGDCIGACSIPDYDGTTPLCIGNCGAPLCLKPCSSGSDGGDVDLYNDFLVAIAAPCQSECQVGSNWSCVAGFHWPSVQPGPSRILALGLVEFQLPTPQTGVDVQMCTGGNLNCEPDVDHGTTNASGVVSLTDNVNPIGGLGLDGYLSVTAGNLVPTNIQWGFPLSQRHGILSTPIPVLTSTDLDLVLSLAKLTADPATGQIALIAVDCLGNQAPGVRVSATNGTTTLQAYYAGKNALDQIGPTGVNGAAFFFNVPPGTYTVAATPDGLGRVASQQTVVVRAGTLTEVGMQPTPSPP
jgi:hypothetical protein